MIEALDPVLLARIQFATTIGFHFIFPPITIGLAWLLVIIEGLGWLRRDAVYERLGRFLAPLLGITFAVGLATGITMEFQFGTNWAGYSRFVGDIFGAPLAAEAILSFFLESTFIAVYLFARDKVPKAVHWFSSLMVAVGATMSAFWILVANSWQQTPAGFVINSELGRAELDNFWQAVNNPSMFIRFYHVIDACIIIGAFFLCAIFAYILIKDRNNEAARRGIRLALIVALIASALEAGPFGDMHARQVATNQPAKLATFEGLIEGTTHAPFVLFGIPRDGEIVGAIRIPNLLSRLVGGTPETYVPGRADFPADELPPLELPFVSFHLMVALGLVFIGVTALGVYLLIRKKLWDARWFLKMLIIVSPLPIVASQLGWIAAEVGRQPWIVYGVFRTTQGVSPLVSPHQVLFSLILLNSLYLMLGIIYFYLIARETKRGPRVLSADNNGAGA